MGEIKSSSSENIQAILNEKQHYYFKLAVLSALFTGFLFSVILLTTKILIEVYDFPPMQLNYDVNLSYGVILFIFYY